MRLLVERIEVEKINNNRKHIKLTIYFNFKSEIISRELKINGKKCSSIYSKIA